MGVTLESPRCIPLTTIHNGRGGPYEKETMKWEINREKRVRDVIMEDGKGINGV